jgi:hypothetical protein
VAGRGEAARHVLSRASILILLRRALLLLLGVAVLSRHAQALKCHVLE